MKVPGKKGSANNLHKHFTCSPFFSLLRLTQNRRGEERRRKKRRGEEKRMRGEGKIYYL
jgi:hypothetical protein